MGIYICLNTSYIYINIAAKKSKNRYVGIKPEQIILIATFAFLNRITYMQLCLQQNFK